MAHITKFKAHTMPQMFAHINRERDQIGKYSNADIDPTKTPQNIALVQGNFEDFQKRLNETSYFKRKDLVVCVGVVVTLPEELKEATDKKKTDFFKTCNDFLTQKFGAENCVYSVIHNDETTPHLHYGFMPVVEIERKFRSADKKGQTYKEKRISVHHVITKSMLNTFHDELQAHIAKKFPDVRIVSEEKEQRLKQNKSIAELKQKEIELLTTLSKKEKKNKKNIFGIVKNDEIVISAEQYEILQRKTEDLLDVKSGKMFEDYEKLKADNKELQNQIENQNNEIQKQIENQNKEIEKQVKEKTADLRERLERADKTAESRAWECYYKDIKLKAAEEREQKAKAQADKTIAEANERAQKAIDEANERAQKAEREKAEAQSSIEALEGQNRFFKVVLGKIWGLIKPLIDKTNIIQPETKKTLAKLVGKEQEKKQTQGYSR